LEEKILFLFKNYLKFSVWLQGLNSEYEL
jgi:hypothetical protein